MSDSVAAHALLNNAYNDVLGLIVEYIAITDLIRLLATGDPILRLKLSQSVYRITHYCCSSDGRASILPKFALEALVGLKVIRSIPHHPWSHSKSKHYWTLFMDSVLSLPSGMREITLSGAKYIEFSPPHLQNALDLSESFPCLETLSVGNWKKPFRQSERLKFPELLSFPSTLTKLKIMMPPGIQTVYFLDILPLCLQFLALPLTKLSPQLKEDPEKSVGTSWLSRLVQLRTLKLIHVRKIEDHEFSSFPASLLRLDLRSLALVNSEIFFQNLPRGLIQLRINRVSVVDETQLPMGLLLLSILESPANAKAWPRLIELKISKFSIGRNSALAKFSGLPSSLKTLYVKSSQGSWDANVINAIPRGLTSLTATFPDSSIDEFACLKADALRAFPPQLKHLRYLSPLTMGGLFDDDFVDPLSTLIDATNHNWLPETLETMAYDEDSAGYLMHRIKSPPYWASAADTLRQDRHIDLEELQSYRLPLRLCQSDRKMAIKSTRYGALKCAKQLAARGTSFEAPERLRNASGQIGALFRTYQRASHEHLFSAACAGHLPIVKWLTAEYKNPDGHPVPLDKTDIFGFNIAHYAASSNQPNILSWIKEQGPLGEALLFAKTPGLKNPAHSRSLIGFSPYEAAIAMLSVKSMNFFHINYPEQCGEGVTDQEGPQLIPMLASIIASLPSRMQDKEVTWALAHQNAVGLWYRIDSMASINYRETGPQLALMIVSAPTITYNQGLIQLLHDIGVQFDHPDIIQAAKASGRLHWLPSAKQIQILILS